VPVTADFLLELRRISARINLVEEKYVPERAGIIYPHMVSTLRLTACGKMKLQPA